MSKTTIAVCIATLLVLVGLGAYVRMQKFLPPRAPYRIGVVLNSPALDQIWE